MIRRPATNQLPLDVPSRPFLLQETTKQTNTNTWYKSKNVFKDNQLYGIDRLYKNGNKTLPMYTSTSYNPLPFKIMHTNIVLLLKSKSACTTTTR